MVDHGIDRPDLAARMLGLPGFVVLAAGEVAGELELLIETGAALTGCPRCGVLATAHGRRPHLLRDVPAAGRPVLVVWSKRVWRCEERSCTQRTWTERAEAIRPRAALTERARVWACGRVGRDGHSVEQVRGELGVGWNTVMRAVTEYGRPLVDDPGRPAGVCGLGVDEHVWRHARAGRRAQFATGIVDLTRGRAPRLLDIVAGRTGRVYADWITARGPGWRAGITVAALDPFRGYATALRTQLPAATRVLDAFHLVRLGNQALDEVRRRVQQDQTGHRGHKGDPLYQARRLLRLGAEKLTEPQRSRLDVALQAGDPDWEVSIAWHCSQQLRAVYHAPDPAAGRRRGQRVLDSFPTCPIPEIARLGRTLRSWRTEFLAYHHTGGLSNGPTEAINLLIEKIRRVGHGFRNFDNYRLRLLLHCGVDWHNHQPLRIRSRHPRFVA